MNTFGCKIDGITFLPRSSGNIFSGGTRNNLSAKYRYYENQYYSLGPGYHLAIRAYNSQTNKSISIELAESDEPLISGMTYPIVLKKNGSISASYSFSTRSQDPNNSNVYYLNYFNHTTSDEIGGELIINHLDEENQIISGEFHFNCINPETEKIIEVVEGRFDLNYEIWF